MNRGKGTDTAFGETPSPPRPISSIVYTFAGGTWQRCLEASNRTLDGSNAVIADSGEVEGREETDEYFRFRDMLDAEAAEGTNDGKNGCGTCCDLRVLVVAIMKMSPALLVRYHVVCVLDAPCARSMDVKDVV